MAVDVSKQEQVRSAPNISSWDYNWRLDGNSAATYGYAFSTDQGQMVFVPEEVIYKGVVANKNQYYFPQFQNKDELKNFYKAGTYIDISGADNIPGYKGLEEQLNSRGQSTKGVLVPESVVSQLSPRNYEIGRKKDSVEYGPIQGLTEKDGQLVYQMGSSGARDAYAYVKPDGVIRSGYTKIRGGLLGELVVGLADAASSIPFLPEIALIAGQPYAYATLKGLQAGAQGTNPLQAGLEAGLNVYLAGGGAQDIGKAVLPDGTKLAQQAVGNAVVQSGTTALGGGDIEDVLKSAGIAAVTPYIGEATAPVSESLGGGAAGGAGASAVRSGITQLLSTGEIDPEKLALSAVAGGVKGYVPDVPSGGTGEAGFFDIGGEGYSPYEEQYGFVADPMPGEDYFDATIRDIEPGIPYTEAPYDDILADLGISAEQPSVYTGDVQDLYGGSGDLFTPSVEHDLSQLPQADYSNEGRNYPTPESTVDSPINITTDIGLGNRELVDINDIIGAPAPAPKAAPAPAAPKPPAPAAAPAPAAQKGLDLGALMAMLGGMYGAQEAPTPEYAPARVTNVSPFGLPYGMRG